MLSVILAAGAVVSAAPPGQETGQDTLEHYIQTGMENNLSLQQHQFSLKQSIQALKEARGMFLPSVSIEARYSRAGGGRIIEFPVGDLMNPVYQSLNQLLTVHGQVPGFPQHIPNEEIPFLREKEHETKLHVVQPVFQPAIYFNAKIKKSLTRMEEAKVKAFKRQLTADIKSAYYNYIKTVEVVKLLDETRKLMQENVRVSESLFRNHKRTEEVVLRAKAELSKLDQQRTEAQKNVLMAAAYFNFLLNRPLDETIRIDSGVRNHRNITPAGELKTFERSALNHREELTQLYSAIAAASQSVKMHGSSVLPTVTGVFDYGFQGEKYRFNGQDDYWMASLVLSWNLFRGGRDKAEKQKAMLEKKRLEAQHKELEHRLRLQVREAWHALQVAHASEASTADQESARKEAFRIVAKKYEQGMVPQIEYIQAQNDLTQASVAHIIARFDVAVKQAQLERAAAM